MKSLHKQSLRQLLRHVGGRQFTAIRYKERRSYTILGGITPWGCCYGWPDVNPVEDMIEGFDPDALEWIQKEIQK